MTTEAPYTTDQGLIQQLLKVIGRAAQSDLVHQLEYVRVENQILRGKLGKRVALSPAEKRRLVKFGVPLGGEIKQCLSIVSYSTFRRWVSGVHRKTPLTHRGRPRTEQDIQKLVIRLAKENNGWGYTRILGELKKLGIKSLSRNTVKNILKEHGLDPAPKRGEDTWDAFIKRHFQTLWACDFFTKTTWTLLGPKTLYVLFFLNIRTRKVYIAGITQKPTQEWVVQNTQPLAERISSNPELTGLLIRDGDKKFSGDFDNLFRSDTFKVKRIPYRSPNLNPYAEGWVGTIKRECLDHFVVFGQEHLEYLVKEFVGYYNTVRPHSGMDNQPLEKAPRAEENSIQRESRLGGILNHYYRSG